MINQFNYENILVLVVTILVLIFLIKYLFIFYNILTINLSTILGKISKKVFKRYLDNNINFFIKNSNELLNNCIYVVDGFKDSLANIILIFSELLFINYCFIVDHY